MEHGNPDAYDVVVIGSGAAGMAAALTAAHHGAKVALVERDLHLGGECPNYACIPTKTLLHAARVYTQVEHADEYGIHLGDFRLNFTELMRHKEHVVSQTGARTTAADHLDAAGIALVRGTASFVDHHTLAVNGQRLTSRQFVIATGTTPRIPEIPGLKSAAYLTSRTAFSLKTLPRSLVILGAGSVGVEFAQAFAAFGTDVTLLESADRILPTEDAQSAALIADTLRGYGVEILTGWHTEGVDSDADTVTLTGKSARELRTLHAEQLLLAVGTEPNVADLNLGAVGVLLGKRGIETDEYLRTAAPHIYAAGDVTEHPHYTHTAHAMGTVAGRNASDADARPVNLAVVPRIVFTHLELASVGAREEELEQNGTEFVVGAAETGTLGRALTDSEPHGLVKVFATKTDGKLLGATIVAPRAGEMIHECALALKLGARVHDLASLIHAYPTYSEAIAVAAHLASRKCAN